MRGGREGIWAWREGCSVEQWGHATTSEPGREWILYPGPHPGTLRGVCVHTPLCKSSSNGDQRGQGSSHQSVPQDAPLLCYYHLLPMRAWVNF